LTGTETAVSVTFQTGCIITVEDGQHVGVGDVLARIHRNPPRPAILPVVCRALPSCSKRVFPRMPACWLNVPVRYRSVRKPRVRQRLVITDVEGLANEFLIPKEKHVLVHDGQMVTRGEMIVDGPADPHDILRLLGCG